VGRRRGGVFEVVRGVETLPPRRFPRPLFFEREVPACRGLPLRKAASGGVFRVKGVLVTTSVDDERVSEQRSKVEWVHTLEWGLPARGFAQVWGERQGGRNQQTAAAAGGTVGCACRHPFAPSQRLVVESEALVLTSLVPSLGGQQERGLLTVIRASALTAASTPPRRQQRPGMLTHHTHALCTYLVRLCTHDSRQGATVQVPRPPYTLMNRQAPGSLNRTAPTSQPFLLRLRMSV
jgi:hypothetical protein